jgi:hypothetical protein
MEEVEQEREVEIQVEEIREVQKPLHLKALKFPGLHSHISHFVATGVLDGSHAFDLAFLFLSRTSLGMKFRLDPRPKGTRLLLSLQFKPTI